MEDYKSILQSRTIIGIVLSLVAFAYPAINSIVSTDDALNIVGIVSGLVSAIAAIVFRVRATKVIAGSESQAIDKLNAASAKRTNHDEQAR